MSFGEKLAAYRKRREMNQQLFAKLVGIHPVHLSKIETGKTASPKKVTVVQMIDVLNLTQDESLDLLLESANLHEALNLISPQNGYTKPKNVKVFEELEQGIEALLAELRLEKQKLFG